VNRPADKTGAGAAWGHHIEDASPRHSRSPGPPPRGSRQCARRGIRRTDNEDVPQLLMRTASTDSTS